MGNIRVIGPKGSGKTTYLAALAYQPLRSLKEYQNLKVQAVNDDTRNLADKAENIISQGASVEPTSSEVTNIYDLPSYSFNIELKRRFQKQQEQINLVARDYPGEIFEDLEFGSSNPLHQEFIEECLTADVNGCLILLTHWQSGTDSSYGRIVQRFIELMDKYERTSNLRLAIAMSKCERGELWPGRLDPHTDLFNVHLPRTTHILQQNIPAQNLGFYAISTFGVLGRKDPRPNRTQEWGTDGKLAVLRDAKKWRPYNLVAPLYWLSTGRKLGNDA